MYLIAIVSTLICMQLISSMGINDVGLEAIGEIPTVKHQEIPRAAEFLRFGRELPPSFLRFGRTPPNFLRFGREPSSNKFLRFGRAGEFLRFG